MRRNACMVIFVAIMALALVLPGCSTPANAPAATTAPATAAPTAAPTPTEAPTAAPTPSPTPVPTASPSAAPATQDFTVDAPAFKLYNLVKLGMTKDEADSATGVPGEALSPDDKDNNLYTYTDDQGCGVRVWFNDQNKAYSKEVFYNDPASVLGPLTPKAVTHDEYDQISTSMTYQDVVAVLGSDGVIGCVTADKADCASNLALKRFWGNKDGSYIEVDFNSNGTVDSTSYNEYQPE